MEESDYHLIIESLKKYQKSFDVLAKKLNEIVDRYDLISDIDSNVPKDIDNIDDDKS